MRNGVRFTYPLTILRSEVNLAPFGWEDINEHILCCFRLRHGSIFSSFLPFPKYTGIDVRSHRVFEM